MLWETKGEEKKGRGRVNKESEDDRRERQTGISKWEMVWVGRGELR